MASDNENDEDFVTYGTPLEPLEEDEPLRKPVPLHEQTVKDEKGRYQRFHGAFTGGFSAGYFNTVGSKEGWAPSTFVSSRIQKAEKHHARPEDFMDEEDFSEHGIAPREITTSQEFSSSRRDEAAEKARAVGAQAALIPGDTLLEELIAPARLSIGVELLRTMGWKEGQGVGPRVKRKPRRQQTKSGAKTHGCPLPRAGSEESEDDDDEFAPENVTFAPKDVTPMDFTPKLGVQGLGYHGLDPGLALLGRGADEHIDLFRPQSEKRSRLFGEKKIGLRRGGVAGQAFGVGALEDDDEDVYHRDSMSKYDTVLGGEEPGDSLYGWTAPQQYTKRRDRSKDASYIGKILEGFTLAQNPPEKKTVFPPPTLPSSYRPVHHFRPQVNVSRLSGVSPALAEALKSSRGHMVKEEPPQSGRHQLDSSQRRVVLGEDPLKGPGSVMELLRPEDRERLLNMRKPSAPDPQVVTHAASPAVTPPSAGVQQQHEALAAWRGVHTSSQTFKPFEETPSKQARYELYLNCLRQGDKDALELSLDPTMTEWERSREREEFVRASVLYRPSSSSLSSRFTRGKQEEDKDTVEVTQDQEGDVDDKQSAVKMKMFGKLTRETFEWHPDKLLCKRFNVPDPYPGSGVLGLPKVKRDKFSVFNFLTMENRGTTEPPKPPELGKKSRWDVSEARDDKKKSDNSASELPSAARHRSEAKPEQASAPAPALPAHRNDAAPAHRSEEEPADTKTDDDDEEKKDEEEEEEESRPPMDLFKAIFASSSDEEKSSSSEGESDDEDRKEEEANTESQQAADLFTAASSSGDASNLRTAASSSGDASNLRTAASSSGDASNLRPEVAVSSRTSEQQGEEFGPKLPPSLSADNRYRGGTSVGPPAQEVKVGKKSKEKKHKNKKHSKHKKDKKKKKPKKHKQQKKSKKESHNSSEDSDEEDDPVSTDKLLKRLKSNRSNQTW